MGCLRRSGQPSADVVPDFQGRTSTSKLFLTELLGYPGLSRRLLSREEAAAMISGPVDSSASCAFSMALLPDLNRLPQQSRPRLEACQHFTDHIVA